jgi:hypothetical protein
MVNGLDGNWSGFRTERGMLIEYISGVSPLILPFEFNPASITRSRTVTVKAGSSSGNRNGYDFKVPSEAARAAQGVSVNSETLTVKILLDATDRMNSGEMLASTNGVQPELDVIRSMQEPKIQAPEGVRTLAALGQGDNRAFSRQQFASVLLFKWGIQTLPVFMTQAQIDVKEYMPTLIPYRAEATLTLQIIESRNPFYEAELKRQFALAKQVVGSTFSFTLGV